jgi:hypothetical protein
VLKLILKLTALLLLLAGYWALHGFELGGDPWRAAWAVLYCAGSVMALWMRGKPVGELRPVSLRAVYVVAGSILMFWAVFMMLTTKDFMGTARSKKRAWKQQVIP